MASMVDVICHNKKCKKVFQARAADVARGWGKFCSKSCKAKKQTSDTGISGAHYKAAGRSVHQMRSGTFAKSKFHGLSRKEGARRHGIWRYGERMVCHICGEWATNGIYSICGIEWTCDDHHDAAHPFLDENW